MPDNDIFYIACAYKDRNSIKELGAKWDAARKNWYFHGEENLEKFRAWLPENYIEEYFEQKKLQDAVESQTDIEEAISEEKSDSSISIATMGLRYGFGRSERKEIRRWMIAEQYIIDSYTPTEKGLEAGISVKQINGNNYLYFNENMQKLIMAHLC